MSRRFRRPKDENFLPRLAMVNRLINVLRDQRVAAAQAQLLAPSPRSTNGEPANSQEVAVESASLPTGAMQSQRHVLETGVGSGEPGDLELMDEDLVRIDGNVASDGVLPRDKSEKTGSRSNPSYGKEPNDSSEEIVACHRCGYWGRGVESWCYGCAVEEFNRDG